MMEAGEGMATGGLREIPGTTQWAEEGNLKEEEQDREGVAMGRGLTEIPGTPMAKMVGNLKDENGEGVAMKRTGLTGILGTPVVVGLDVTKEEEEEGMAMGRSLEFLGGRTPGLAGGRREVAGR